MAKRRLYTSDVLAQVDGLSKRDLYYLEEGHLIHPAHVQRGKVEFRVYSAKDLENIKGIHHYTSQGFSPKVAYAKFQSEGLPSPEPQPNDSRYGALTTAFSSLVAGTIHEGEEVDVGQIMERVADPKNIPVFQEMIRTVLPDLPLEKTAPDAETYRLKKS